MGLIVGLEVDAEVGGSGVRVDVVVEGGFVDSWCDEEDVWCSVRESGGEEEGARRTVYTGLLEPGECVLEQRLVRDREECLGRGLVAIVARQREEPAK